MYTKTSPILAPATPLDLDALYKAWMGSGAWRLVDLNYYLHTVTSGAVRLGIDPVVILAQWHLETAGGKSLYWQERLNPAGLGITGDFNQNAASQTWDTGTDAAFAHLAHMTAYLWGEDWVDHWPATWPEPIEIDKRFAAPILAGYHARTLGDLNGTWAVDPDDNYGGKLADRANTIMQFAKEQTPMPGTWQDYFNRMFGTGWRISQDWAVYGGPDLYEYGSGHGLDGSQHTGIDVAIPYGTKLYAPYAGSVVCAGTGNGLGFKGTGCAAFNDYGDGASTVQGVGRIEIQYPYNHSLIFGHSRTVLVQPGQAVTAGQQIGTSGGMYGAHIHLEARWWDGSKYILFDPRLLLAKFNEWDSTTPAPEPEPEPETPTMPAFLDYSSLSFPVEVRFIPASQTNQRTGIPMDPAWSTWHDTGNTGVGTNAESHARYLAAGCPDQYGRPTKKSWHFSVDSEKAIQHIPLNEVAWHAGDGAGPGNYTSIAIEECVNSDRDPVKTRKNAAELHAFLIDKLDLQGGTLAALVQHNHWSGKNCPATIRALGLWGGMQELVKRHLTGSDEIPELPNPIAPLVPYTDAIVGDGQLILAFPVRRTLSRDVITRKWALAAGDIVKPGTLPKGTEVELAYIAQGDDLKFWVITTNGWRFHADAVVEV